MSARYPFVALLLALSMPAQAADLDPSVMTVKREADLQWMDYPGAPGIRFAVLHGNPSAAGPYVIRVRFAPGTMSPPHVHLEERQVVVLKGTWWVGTGAKWDKEATTALPPGSFAVHRAGEAHYDGAKDEEVIVQVSGTGPSGTKMVDAAGQAK
jgi:quercetin dioxygenase-like cupin family protein